MPLIIFACLVLALAAYHICDFVWFIRQAPFDWRACMFLGLIVFEFGLAAYAIRLGIDSRRTRGKNRADSDEYEGEED